MGSGKGFEEEGHSEEEGDVGEKCGGERRGTMRRRRVDVVED